MNVNFGDDQNNFCRNVYEILQIALYCSAFCNDDEGKFSKRNLAVRLHPRDDCVVNKIAIKSNLMALNYTKLTDIQ